MNDRHIAIDLEFTPASRKYPIVRKVIHDEDISTWSQSRFGAVKSNIEKALPLWI